MKLFLPDPEIGPEDGFTKNDIFGYADFGKSLGNLLAAIDEPLVMALDGPWGSGKSIFTKMWAGYLRQQKFPVIYFDAFANDYMDDAFLALAGEVVELAATDEDAKASLMEKLVPAAKTTLRFGVKALARIGTAGAIGDSEIEMVEDAVKGIAGDAASMADEALIGLLEGRAEQRQTLEDFRMALGQLVEELQPDVAEDDRKPLIFIIDELDRCRPDFALDILERIKHVFSTHKVHFVLVTHLEQLANAVRVRYGAGIDAETYLQKFYQIAVTLPGGDEVEKDRAPGTHLIRVLQSNDFTASNTTGMNDVFRKLEILAIELKLSFRTISRIYSQLIFAFLSGHELQDARINLMLGLAVLRVRRLDLYDRAKRGLITTADMEEVFGFSGWQPKHVSLGQEILLHWRFSIDRDWENFPDEEREIANVAFRQSELGNQFEALRMVALSMEKLRLS